jgi:hypothetical protein
MLHTAEFVILCSSAADFELLDGKVKMFHRCVIGFRAIKEIFSCSLDFDTLYEIKDASPGEFSSEAESNQVDRKRKFDGTKQEITKFGSYNVYYTFSSAALFA